MYCAINRALCYKPCTVLETMYYCAMYHVLLCYVPCFTSPVHQLLPPPRPDFSDGAPLLRGGLRGRRRRRRRRQGRV